MCDASSTDHPRPLVPCSHFAVAVAEFPAISCAPAEDTFVRRAEAVIGSAGDLAHLRASMVGAGDSVYEIIVTRNSCVANTPAPHGVL